MTLEAFVESLDSLDDSVKGLYTQAENGYILNVKPVAGYALENVHGLKTALGKERKRGDELEGRFKKFGEIDPEVASKAIQELEKYKNFDPKSEADKLAQEKFKFLEEQLKSKYKEEKDGLLTKLNSIAAQFEKATVESEAVSAISKLEGNVKLLLPHIKAQIATSIKDDGTFTYTVVDGNGVPRIGDSNGSPMTIEQLVSEMRNSDTYAIAFKAQNKTGGGITPTVGVSNKGNPAATTATSKISAGLSKLGR